MFKAPEQFGLKPSYSAASDVFALGVIFWALATGRLPYAGVADIGRYLFDSSREEIPANVPAVLASLISRCWSQRAEDRPTIDAIVQELEQQQVVPRG